MEHSPVLQKYCWIWSKHHAEFYHSAMQIFISSVAVHKSWRQGLTGHVFKESICIYIFFKTPESNLDSIFKIYFMMTNHSIIILANTRFAYNHKKVFAEHNEKRSKFISSLFRFSDLVHQCRFQPLTIFLYSSKQHDSPLYLLLFLPEGELRGMHCFGHFMYICFAAVFFMLEKAKKCISQVEPEAESVVFKL